MLCFDHVSFAYPGERTILNDLSFSVSEGEQVGLIGANGAGKSTLMKAALGLITVSGTITIDGLEMNRDNLADIRRRLGYVLQDSDNQMFMPTVRICSSARSITACPARRRRHLWIKRSQS